jgi:hypothetical protein
MRRPLVFSSTDETAPQPQTSQPAVRVDSKNQVIVSGQTGAMFALIVLLSFTFVCTVATTAMMAVNIGMLNSQSSRIDDLLNITSSA